jgi:hypothetical protein
MKKEPNNKKLGFPALFESARAILVKKLTKRNSTQSEKDLVMDMFDYGHRCYNHLHPDPTKSGELAPQKGGE